MTPAKTRTRIIDCDCPSGRRGHGTAHGYNIHKCGCEPCRAAYRAYRNEFTHGPRAYVSAVPVAERLLLLQSRGLSLTLLAARFGVTRNALYKITSPTNPQRRCRREFADYVFATPIPTKEGF